MHVLPTISTRTAGPWLVAGAAFLWATAGIASRYAAPELPAAVFGEARMSLGGLALLAAIGPRRLLRTLLALPRVTLLVTAVALALFQWSFFAAVARSGAGLAALSTGAAAPFAAEALAAWRARRAPPRRWWPGVAAAAASVALLAHGAGAPLSGLLVGLAGGLAYAVYTTGAARLQRARGVADAGLASTAIALLTAGVVLLPALGPQAGSVLLAMCTPRGLLVSAYLGLITTALAYALFVAGLRHLTPASALALVQVQPMAAVLLGAWLLGEHFDLRTLAAMLTIAAAVLTSSFKPASVVTDTRS